MTPHDAIDTAIDHAAARLTSATPSGTLRTNVMSRIASQPTPRFAWRHLLAGAAVASLALVAFVSLRHRAIPDSTIPTPTLINQAAANSSAAVHPTVAANTPSPVTSVARTAANGSGQVVFALDANQEGSSVPALEHPELMTITPLLERSPIKAIDFQPIGRVAPLVVPAIGDDNQ